MQSTRSLQELLGGEDVQTILKVLELIPEEILHATTVSKVNEIRGSVDHVFHNGSPRAIVDLVVAISAAANDVVEISSIVPGGE